MKAQSQPPKPISVVIVEDHPMFREQLRQLIDKTGDMVVSGEVDNIRDGFDLIKQTRPSIAIVDITLKGSNALELLRKIRTHGIDVPVLILSMHDESLYAERALRAGARGYITKHEASENVMLAIRQVLRGDIYLNREFMSRLATKVMKGSVLPGDPIARLTDRELGVFELIGRGLTTRQISEELGLGLTTVDTYQTRIREKLNLENISRLRIEASRWVQQRE